MIIDLGQSDKTFWVVKFPAILTEKIKNLKNESQLGEININPADDIQFSISPNLMSPGFPTEYKISKKKKSTKIFLLNEDALEGYAFKEIFINPVHNEVYYEYITQRNKQIHKTPQIKIINYRNEGKQAEGFGTISEVEYLARHRKKLLQAKKRERLDRTEVLDMIFRAFERHNKWSVRDLSDFTGQPLAYIQELLPDICNVNKKDYKGLYELKPEFKNERNI